MKSIKEQEKFTKTAWERMQRNESMYVRWKELMSIGCMKTAAYDIIGKEFGVETRAAVYSIIKAKSLENN